MKNIYILPTDKPSRLNLGVQSNSLVLLPITVNKTSLTNPQNIYITNDEEIKEGDYYWDENKQKVKRYFEKRESYPSLIHRFKIILTTDGDLIKDGVQAIPDEFLQWFVKNPSCEKVKIEKWYGSTFETNGIYKIIIPSEEQKIVKGGNDIIFPASTTINFQPKQETLEEVAERYVNKYYSEEGYKRDIEESIKFGAQLQQERMYSKEDVIAFGEFIFKHSLLTHTKGVKSLFEQFKKK